MPDRIAELQSELNALQKQRKEAKRIEKIANTWVDVKKHPPEAQRVLAWANDQMELCWWNDGKFYAYDGTFFLLEKDRIEGVSHWMAKDWMYTQAWPLYGPGIKNRLRYHWQRFTRGASNMAHDLRPGGWGNKAQLDKKIVYFQNERTGEIRMGLPESFPATAGFHKVICNSAHEAEVWSDKLRQYNCGKETKKDDEREQVEGEYRKAQRENIHHLMSNSSSKYGREFLQRHLERMDKAEARGRMKREEFNHAEGFERGH